ncbi:hypothetical protein OsJ_26342 [Oryza sativa Japonica Group]|uniref:Uncharacterized protein n=1 Tax=Oryza sativa subsp. japonica TaxID=39947 RepID=A3BQG3_ORYSJ|nr:hypothetical protein OsJ_26342 [Oryza sativa Japonica Group]
MASSASSTQSLASSISISTAEPRPPQGPPRRQTKKGIMRFGGKIKGGKATRTGLVSAPME